ncbi:MAG: hypothetical protein WCH35_04560 [Comamonadaceae bacterium]
MSLLSPDSLLLYLAPDKVQAVQLHGWRNRIAGLHQLPVNAESPDDWSALLEATLRLVKAHAPQSVRIVLSDHLVRYFCVPWRGELRNATEELAFARLSFEDTYGVGSGAGWRMILSNETPGLTRLTAAVPDGLIAGLQEAFHKAKVKLTSVRPQLVSAVQAFSKSLPSTGWIMSHEATRLSIAGWDSGGWRWVSSSRIANHAPNQLVARLQQELMLAGAWPAVGIAPIQGFVCAPTLAAQNWPTVDGLHLTTWKSPADMLARIQQTSAGLGMTEAKLTEFGHALVGVLS